MQQKIDYLLKQVMNMDNKRSHYNTARVSAVDIKPFSPESNQYFEEAFDEDEVERPRRSRF